MTKRRLRAPLAVVAVIAVVAAGCSMGGDDLADGAEVVGTGDTYEAIITRTAGGIPHITADSVANLSFGQGWASGTDHTCDLADMVLKLNGERARWLGPGAGDANINSDIAARHVGIRDIAAEDWPGASPRVREAITAFTAGWNGQLEAVGVDGVAGWCAGEPWVRTLEPVEVYAWSRAVALLASAQAVENYVATAEPPALDTAADPGLVEAAAASTVAEDGLLRGAVASNGWAIGSDRTADGGGMLVANPHFPWEGALRFWEVHLTVPGEVNAYGAQLSGLPGLAVGFTEQFGWTHTVSAGNRFTAYLLDLVPGDPTSYVYGDEVRAMVPNDITIEVLGDDGEVTEQTVTRWSSHYGPILDFPGVGWTAASTISMRDGNIENDEFPEQYLAMLEAANLDEFIDAHAQYQGVPAFNTIAVSADGRAWYADTSATPKLSDAALAAYEELKATNLIVGVAAGSGAVLLDGSDPVFEWQEVDGARDPGLVPYAEMPVLERSDYVFNANDSFWMPHATELLNGDYSPLHGAQQTPRTPRTRENALVLDDPASAGDDGRFSLDELAALALDNTGFTARKLRGPVVERCVGAGPVAVDAVAGSAGGNGLPAGEIDITEACEVLAQWDGVYDIDSSGAVLWREFIGRFDATSRTDAGLLWANGFDPADPLGTPYDLAPPIVGGTDQVLENLARAVQVLDAAGVGPDVTLGEMQVAVRNGVVVPIHGGNSADGTTNQVGGGAGALTSDPLVTSLRRTPVAPGSGLAEVTGDGTTTVGYRIATGTSFLMALAFGADGPVARTFVTYSNTEDRSNPNYVEATERFSAKQWRDVLFTPDQVAGADGTTVVVRG